MKPEEIREKLKEAGWYERTFEASGVVAVNPMYKDLIWVLVNAGMMADGWKTSAAFYLYIRRMTH